MAEASRVVASIPLKTTEPTWLSFQDLFTWVIWQFPKETGLDEDGLCGAVRPPLADHGWYPAVIDVKKQKVQVYAHLDRHYPSPETAADHFHHNGSKI